MKHPNRFFWKMTPDGWTPNPVELRDCRAGDVLAVGDSDTPAANGITVWLRRDPFPQAEDPVHYEIDAAILHDESGIEKPDGWKL